MDYWTTTYSITNLPNLYSKCFSYHPGAVLKDRYSQNKNSIFGFSVISYPRPRWDLERVPLTASQKHFDKIQWKNNVQNRKQIDSHWIRTSVALSMLFSHSAICDLFLLGVANLHLQKFIKLKNKFLWI